MSERRWQTVERNGSRADFTRRDKTSRWLDLYGPEDLESERGNECAGGLDSGRAWLEEEQGRFVPSQRGGSLLYSYVCGRPGWSDW